jgi:hypothetical protein
MTPLPRTCGLSEGLKRLNSKGYSPSNAFDFFGAKRSAKVKEACAVPIKQVDINRVSSNVFSLFIVTTIV